MGQLQSSEAVCKPKWLRKLKLHSKHVDDCPYCTRYLRTGHDYATYTYTVHKDTATRTKLYSYEPACGQRRLKYTVGSHPPYQRAPGSVASWLAHFKLGTRPVSRVHGAVT